MKNAARFVLFALPALLISLLVVRAEPSAAQGGTAELEWLGHNAWRVTSPGGKVLLLNPFVNNPDSILGVDDISHADMVLVTNGHGDEVGQAVQIAENTGARVIPGSFGFGNWFIERGIPASQVSRVSPGDRVRADGITIRLINSIHGSDLNAGRVPGDPVQSMGIASSFFITFENGWTLFYGGSSAATQDMAMWAAVYKPDAAILYMGSDAEPMDFAMRVKLLMTDNPNLNVLFPGHHRFVQPPGATTVAEVQTAINSMGLGKTVTEPAPGVPYAFTK